MNAFWRPKVDDEVSAELDFHLAMRIRELEARGMSRAEAERVARERLGDVATIRTRMAKLGNERNRMRERREVFGELRQDVRFALRALRQQPAFTAVALLTLALGIGATTAIFSLLYSVVLRPLPIPELERVMAVADGRATGGAWSVAVGNYAEYRRDSRSFESMGAIHSGSFNLAEGDAAERIVGGRADIGYFRVFRIAPALGRPFTAEEDQPGAAGTVLLSDRLWRRRFGADPGVLGRTIVMNGIGYRVVGVMPPGFSWRSDELWVPAGFTPAQLANHDEHYLDVYGRLREGMAEAAALSELDAVARRIAEEQPEMSGGLRGSITPMFEQFVGTAPDRLWVLFGAVAVVLLIACVNVANLLLARGTSRERELAVRAALGAGRGRIVRQLVTENFVLAVGAGLAGLLVAAAAVELVVASAPPAIPRIEEAKVDGVALLFAMAAALGSTFMFGLVPALRAAPADLPRTLREGSKGTAGPGRDWLRRGLVAAEVGLAMVLLVGSGLLIRTAIQLGRVDPGFDPSGLLTAQVSLPRDGYGEWERVTGTFTRLIEGVGAAPGVETAALASQVPLGPGGNGNGVVPEGRPLSVESAIESRMRLVSPGYLATMGIALERGRDFTLDDRRGTTRVMIVNARLAELAWPGENPIGKRVACCEGGPDGPVWKEIVGVVGNVRWGGLAQDPGPEFYLPVSQAPPQAWDWIQRTMTIVARGRNNADLTNAIRSSVRAIDPTVPVHNVASMDERIRRSLAQSRFNTQLFTALGSIGLTLAAIGIYGVISYFVARRVRELGIRLALGASAPQIRRLILLQGIGPVAVGIGVGAVAALALTRVLSAQLYGVTPHDPVTFVAVAGFLLAIAILATLGPARRATRVDPITTIREE